MAHITRRRHVLCGLTLIELMVGLAVVAVLAATVAPFLGDVLANARLRQAGNLLFGELQEAQGEAVKRRTTMRLAISGAGLELLDVGKPAAPEVLRTRAVPEGAVLPVRSVDFGPDGRPLPAGAQLAIDVGSASGVCSEELRCPGLRVSATGALRLCANHQTGCP